MNERRKAQLDARFSTAETALAKLPERLLTVLSDDNTPELATAVQRVSRAPYAHRIREPKDLGETMVIAHTFLKALRGHNVIILVDDQGGQANAAHADRILASMRHQGKEVGSIRYITTPTVLRDAIRKNLIRSKAEFRKIYQQLKACDDGLLPLETTDFLSPKYWET